MNTEDPKSELERLIRERAAVDEKASKIEEQAEIIARARSGPRYGPEGSRQSGYTQEKQKALAKLSARNKQERDALDEKIAAARERARGTDQGSEKTKDQEQRIDMTALQKAAIDLEKGKPEATHDAAQKEAIEKTLTAKFNKAAHTLTAEFNKQAGLDRD